MDNAVTSRNIADILIVDDSPANAKMLSMLFKKNGYGARVAFDGKTVLEIVRENLPDLILLDIDMPDMDGYEVCRILKLDEKARGIPVIFISSLSETLDKINAFKVGGVDYVTKPFHVAEVLARVETHLGIMRLQNELLCQKQSLEQIVQEHRMQLAETCERLAGMDHAKDEFLNILLQKLRVPVNVMSGVEKLRFNENDPERGALDDIFKTSRKNMMIVLDEALLLSQAKVSDDTFTSPQSTPLALILEEAVARLRAGGMDPCPEISLADVNLSGDSSLLVKAFSHLIETAAKFSSGQAAVLRCRRTFASVEITISAKGRTMPDELIPDLFDVFAVSRPISDVGDLGLGPSVAHRILSLFGGSVTVRNDEPSGVSFIVNCRTAAASAAK